jgi:hypothetical protein
MKIKKKKKKPKKKNVGNLYSLLSS